MAKKKKTLNKADKFYIKENFEKFEPEDLQEDLNVEDVAITEDEIKRVKKGVVVEDLLAKKEERGVVVMTEQASQLADERRSDRIKAAQNANAPDRRTDNRRDRKYRTDAIRPIK